MPPASRKARPAARPASMPISRAPNGLEAVARSARPSMVWRNIQARPMTRATQQPAMQSDWPDISTGPMSNEASVSAGVREASGPNITSPAPSST